MMMTMMALVLVLQDAPADLATKLCVRGKLLLSEDFAAPELGVDWKKSKGEWAVVDGALRGKELAADAHAAVLKRALPAKDAVIQLSFRFDGAKQASVSFDGKGHVCRVILTPAGFTLRRDAAKGEKPLPLAKAAADFKPGEWHRLLIEIRGGEFLAQVDDKTWAFGQDDGVAAEKTTFGFPVSGDSFSVDSLRIWEALPNPAWPDEKFKLPGKP
jgi:hypothetical protein